MRRGGIPFDQLQKTNNYAEKKKRASKMSKFHQDDIGAAADQDDQLFDQA